MSAVSHRVRGVKILKAVSSPLRLQILNFLFDKGLLSYSELMSSLKMNPSRDAGRFAYHLKFLLKADLIEADVETRKYCLTDMGKMVIDVADKIERRAFKPKSLLVRTSRFSLEEFDANKITNSLIKEARMPAELAQKVANEAEKRLLKFKTKYLTAPLVREVVNAILIEKGLEEYRHKLTRLGLPVYDVASLVNLKGKTPHGFASIHETAGETVLKEYMLLNIFPRDIADAHLSGSLHINGLSSWTLKPSEIVHDLRFFFQNGLNLEKINASQPSYSPPKNLGSALSITFNVLSYSAKETSETQTLEYFNVFLAPFVRGMEPAEIKEILRLFIFNVNQHANAHLGLELTIPDFVADKPPIGPSGKQTGKYGDFVEETQLLASLILEIFAEESALRPLFSPKIIFKIRSETLADQKATAIVLKAYQLASERGTPYFVNLLEKEGRQSVFSASGFKLGADSNGDWEIDTLRAGCLGHVTVNLPRIAYESGKDKARFFEILRERCEMAARALEIKDRALKQYSEGLLPFLMQSVNGDHYLRLEKSSSIINLAGLREAVEAFRDKSAAEDERDGFSEEIAQSVIASTGRLGRRRGKRLFPAALPDFEASERLAQMDIERYGIGKVRFSGTREKPFYSTVRRLAFQDGKILAESPSLEEKTHELRLGGSLTVIELGEAEHRPDELVFFTKQAFEGHDTELLAYNRRLTHCINCRRSWFGLLQKCPTCGSTGTLTVFDRFASA